MVDLPCLTYKDMLALRSIRLRYPMQFYQNVTSFYIRQMSDYIKDCRVWRNVLMGETRGGKSETAATIAKLYTNIFNEHLKRGQFKRVDVGKHLRIEPLTFELKHIVGSQSEYIYTLREAHKEKTLRFGQIWQIDENRVNVGGLGTFSESLDLMNVNNIVAKFMQSELWLTPIKLQQRNAPYGLYVYQKDTINRVNWCLLYKIEMNVKGTTDYIFLGWIKVPLHKDEELRQNYDIKKNEWIAQEIDGTVDKRVIERKHTAELLAQDVLFAELRPSGKSFKYSKEQQMAILEQYIIDGKTQRWNEMEMWRIVQEARMIALMKLTKQKIAKLEVEV